MVRKLLLLTGCAIALTGCLSQSQIQSRYVDAQDSCRWQTARIFSSNENLTNKLGNSISAGQTPTSAYGECMTKAGWRVSTPKPGGTQVAVSPYPPSGAPSTNPSASVSSARTRPLENAPQSAVSGQPAPQGQPNAAQPASTTAQQQPQPYPQQQQYAQQQAYPPSGAPSTSPSAAAGAREAPQAQQAAQAPQAAPAPVAKVAEPAPVAKTAPVAAVAPVAQQPAYPQRQPMRAVRSARATPATSVPRGTYNTPARPGGVALPAYGKGPGRNFTVN